MRVVLNICAGIRWFLQQGNLLERPKACRPLINEHKGYNRDFP